MQWRRLLNQVLRSLQRSDALSQFRNNQGSSGGPTTKDRPRGRLKPTGSSRGHDASSQMSQDYPGDFTGIPIIDYRPLDDDHADAGEVVWTWVPFEEDYSQGKDRPVLIIGKEGRWLLALQVTSVDHDLDAAQEARQGRYWVDIGTGEWDSRRRPSEVRVNRIIRVNPDDVRRIGAALDKRIFDRVAHAVRQHY